MSLSELRQKALIEKESQEKREREEKIVKFIDEVLAKIDHEKMVQMYVEGKSGYCVDISIGFSKKYQIKDRITAVIQQFVKVHGIDCLIDIHTRPFALDAFDTRTIVNWYDSIFIRFQNPKQGRWWKRWFRKFH